MNEGILIIKRIELSESYYVKSNRSPAISLSHNDIIQRYRGIEGDPWPNYENIGKIKLINGLISLGQYEDIINYYNIVSKDFLCDFLYIQISSRLQFVQTSISDNFIFLGYEYAYYGSENNCYSSIYNEMLYGMYEEMRYYATYLNSNLLLPSTELINKIESTRLKLVEKGADLETIEVGEEFRPIAIYGRK